MIASAASVAAAAGLGCLLQIGLASGKAGGQLLLAISAGLIHENQPTVCKVTAFSWNKYQK